MVQAGPVFMVARNPEARTQQTFHVRGPVLSSFCSGPRRPSPLLSSTAAWTVCRSGSVLVPVKLYSPKLAGGQPLLQVTDSESACWCQHDSNTRFSPFEHFFSK